MRVPPRTNDKSDGILAIRGIASASTDVLARCKPSSCGRPTKRSRSAPHHLSLVPEKDVVHLKFVRRQFGNRVGEATARCVDVTYASALCKHPFRRRAVPIGGC